VLFEVLFKDVLYKDVLFEVVWFKDVLFKDVWFRDVLYKDVPYKDVLSKDVYLSNHIKMCMVESLLGVHAFMVVWFKDRG